MTDKPLKEDELHLWVEIQNEDRAIELVVRFNEDEGLEIGFSLNNWKHVCVLVSSQWKLFQAFLEHGQ